MLANALTHPWKTTTRRRSARRSSVFGKALGNAAVAGIKAYQSTPSFSHVDPQKQPEMLQEMAAEQQGGTSSQTWFSSSDAMPYDASKNARVLGDIQLDSTGLSGDLTPNEMARLATTTTYSGTYVDLYLIARNGGQAIRLVFS